MKPGPLIVALVSTLSIIAMLVLFVVSSFEMSLGAGLKDVAATWWGVTTLVDLGAGLLFIAVWICLLERSAWRSVPWIIALCGLGNFTTLVYLLVRSLRQPTIRDVFLTPRSGAQ